MNLIYRNTVDNIEFKYYQGIDFEVVKNHPKDGSNGMIIFFITKWENEVNKFIRNNKINQILQQSFCEYNVEDIDNDYIAIYQSEGIPIEILFETIKNKIEIGHFPNKSWISISSSNTGAWKIQNSKVIN